MQTCLIDAQGWFLSGSAILAASTLSATCGIGGGGLYVPMISLLFGVPTKEGVGLSNCIALGLSLVLCLFNRKEVDPTNEKNSIFNIRAVAYLEPLTIAGTAIGVWVNEIIPEVMLSIFAALLLLGLAYRTFQQGLERYSDESITLKHKVPEGELRDAELQRNGEDSEEEASRIQNVKSIETAKEFDELDELSLREALILLFPMFASGVNLLFCRLTDQPDWFAAVSSLGVASVGTFVVSSRIQEAGSESWTKSAYFGIMPLCCMIAGILAGFIGIGGGMVKGPLLLELLLLHPGVVRMTSAFMIVFTSFCTVAQYHFLGMLPTNLGTVMFLFGVTGGMAAQVFFKHRIQNRPSLIILAMSLVMFVASVLSLTNAESGHRPTADIVTYESLLC